MDHSEDAETSWIVRQKNEFGRGLGPAAILQAAKREGAVCRWLTPMGALVTVGDRQIGVFANFCTESIVGTSIVTDKLLARALLEDAGVRIPRGRRVHSADDAIAACEEFGRPIVLKPSLGREGVGVTVDLRVPQKIRLAYERAALPGQHVIAEEYIEGTEYRVHADQHACAAVFQRLLPRVLGNGRSTIIELVQEKNLLRERNPTTRSLPIPTDEVAESFLRGKGRSWDSVPAPGETVIIRNVNGLNSGGDSLACFDTVSEQVKQIAVEAVDAIPGLNWAGVDVLLDRETGTAYVIEVNANAVFNGSQFPVFGVARDVGAEIWVRIGDAAACDTGADGPSLSGTTRLEDPGVPPLERMRPLDALLRDECVRRGGRVQMRSSKVWTATVPSDGTLWFHESRSTGDLTRALRFVTQKLLLARTLRLNRIPHIPGRLVSNQHALASLLSEVGGSVRLLPPLDSSSCRRVLQISGESELGSCFEERRSHFVQAFPQGTRFLALADRNESLVIFANSEDEGDRALLDEIAVLAVRTIQAIPQLCWGAVEIVLPHRGPLAGQGLLVEGVDPEPRIPNDYIPLRGSLTAVLDLLISNAQRG